MQPELNALKGDDKAVAMSKDLEIQLDNMDGNSLKK